MESMRIVKGFLDLLTVKFLDWFGQRPQHLLGTIGLGFSPLGCSWLAYLSATWFVSRLPGMEPIALRAAAGAGLFRGVAALWGQLLSVGISGRIFIAYHEPHARSYSTRERTIPGDSKNRGPSRPARQIRQTIQEGRPFDEHACRRLLPTTPPVGVLRSDSDELGIMLGRILAVDSVDMYGLDKDRIRIALAEKKKSLEAERKTVRGDQGAIDAVRARAGGEAATPPSVPRAPTTAAGGVPFEGWSRTRCEWKGAPFAIDKVIQERGWDTIDMVKHDGHLYSSKPPLFPALGRPVLDHPPALRRDARHPALRDRAVHAGYHKRSAMLVYFWLLSKLIERFGRTDWGKVFAMTAAVFATFLTTFAVVVNNHIPAAVCAAIAMHLTVRVWFDGERRWWYFRAGGPGGCVHGDR